MKISSSTYFLITGLVLITQSLNPKILSSSNTSKELGILKLSNHTTKSSRKDKVKKNKKTNTSYIEPITQMEFQRIPAGSFQMGGLVGSETPIHRVQISYDFYMSKYEVTHKEYIQFMNTKKIKPSGYCKGEEWVDMNDKDCAIGFANGHFYFKGSGYAKEENTPMVEVTWCGAKAYTEWLSEMTGKQFRLPTEAEWEYAARAGKKHTFSGSNNVAKIGWCGDVTINEIQPVGLKKSNAFGLFDMTGNVWEWCNDWYDKDYYSISPEVDPTGSTTGSRRVLRGGSWDLLPFFCRIGIRNHDKPNVSHDYYGFRIVASLD